MRWMMGSLFLGLMLSGCTGGDGRTRLPTFAVTGTVTMAGSPLIGANVAFTPTEPGQPIAMGKTNDSGVYTLTTYDGDDGAVKGFFKVTVMKLKVDASSSTAAPTNAAEYAAQYDQGGSHSGKKASGGASANLLPDSYSQSASTSLEATVEEKANTFNFEIK